MGSSFNALLVLALVALQMTATVVTAANGWNLDMVCMPAGEVSTAYFTFVSDTDQPVDFVLTADWGIPEAEQVEAASLGAMENEEPIKFEHIFTETGTFETAFTADMGVQRFTLRKVCEIVESDATRANPLEGTSAAARTSSSTYTMVVAVVATLGAFLSL